MTSHVGPAGSVGSRIGYLLVAGHARCTDLIRASGLADAIWVAISLSLLLIGLVAAATALAQSFRLTSIDGDHRTLSQLSGLYDDLRDTSTDLLVAFNTADGEARMPKARAAWLRIERRFADLCAGVDGADPRGRVELRPLCTQFGVIDPVLDEMLWRDAAPPPPVQHALATRLAALVDVLRTSHVDYTALVERHNRRLDEHQSLLALLAGATAGSLLSGLMLAAGSAARQRRRWLAAATDNRAISETRAQLVEAIEAIPTGFALYDRDERLIMLNARFSQVCEAANTPTTLGMSHAQILQAAAERQAARWRSRAERQAWIDGELARFRNGEQGDVQQIGDGCWFEFYEVRTPSGLTVSIRHEVTAHRLAEQQLKASEERYRELVDSLSDVVFRTDPDNRFTFVSAAVQQLLGITAEEATGQNIATLAAVVHPDDLARFADLGRAARRAPADVHSTMVRIGRGHQAMRHCEVRFRATREVNSAGRLGFTGILRDVHEQVLMERRQRDDTLKLRSIVESAGALILLIDRDLRIVLANRTFITATGDPGRDIAGLPFKEVVNCAIDEATLTAWFAHAHPEALAPVEFDNVLTTPGGSRRVIRVTASPVQNESGHVDYILFLGVDETERRAAEGQLLDAARLATIGQMATAIGHEINQPLTIIGMSAESLLDDVDDGMHRDDPDGFESEVRTRLALIDSQTRRAADIVRELKVFARRPEEHPGLFDVGAAIVGAAGLMHEQMRLANFDVELDVEPDLPPVLGHPNRLQQVLINLIVNARDATEEHRAAAGEVAVMAWIGIKVYGDPGQKSVVIDVCDRGPGIPEALLPRLFEPFFTTKPSGKGTGLGLSISAEIVREMNGTIQAGNRPEGGAHFRILLPTPDDPDRQPARDA